MPAPRKVGQRKLDSGSFKTLDEARKAYERDYVLRTLEAVFLIRTRSSSVM